MNFFVDNEPRFQVFPFVLGYPPYLLFLVGLRQPLLGYDFSGIYFIRIQIQKFVTSCKTALKR